MKNYLTKNLLYILLAAFIAFLLVFKIASADTPGGLSVPQGGTGNTNYPLYLPVLTGTNTLRFASASSTLYLKIGGVTSPVFTATSTGSYFIAGAVPLPTFNGINDFCTGASACAAMIAGQNNIAIGVGALTSTVGTSGNVATGRNALFFSTGSANTAYGFSAGASLLAGNSNCFFGFGADTLINTVNNSCAIGENALVGQSNFIALGGEDPDNVKVGIATSTSWNAADLTINTLAGEDGLFVGSSTAEFLVDRNGNVGIGTTSPGSLFSIGGIANFTTATSSLYGNGIDLKNGCFSIKGVCVTGSGGGGSGSVTSVATNNGLTGGTITTTGTIGLDTSSLSTNALTAWNGSKLVATGTPQLTIGNLIATSSANSSFSGSVGIGDTNPASKLSVTGRIAQSSAVGDTGFLQTNSGSLSNTTNINPGIALFGGDGSNSLYGAWLGYDGTTGRYRTRIAAGNSNADIDFGFNTANGSSLTQSTFSQRLTIRGDNGFVGINNDAPTDRLQIAVADGPISIGDQGFGANYNGIYLNGLSGTGNYNILSKGGDPDLYINSPLNRNIHFRNNNVDKMVLSGSTGNLDIGASAVPLHRLTIDSGTGYVAFDGTLGVPYVGVGYDSTADAMLFRTNVASTDFNTTAMTLKRVTGFVGIGSSTPSAELSVQSNSTSVIPFAVATSSTGTLFYIDAKGNQYTAGDKPTVGTCGAGPTIAAGSNNNAGRITAGSGLVSACTITFADGGFTTTANAPACTVNDESGGSVTVEGAASQTALIITGSTFTSQVITYQCTGF